MKKFNIIAITLIAFCAIIGTVKAVNPTGFTLSKVGAYVFGESTSIKKAVSPKILYNNFTPAWDSQLGFSVSKKNIFGKWILFKRQDIWVKDIYKKDISFSKTESSGTYRPTIVYNSFRNSSAPAQVKGNFYLHS